MSDTTAEDRWDCINRNMSKLRLDIREIVHEEIQTVVEEAFARMLAIQSNRWEEEKVRRRERGI